ncbi:MAG: SRPBCC family protein [Rickettsiales bacterium]
MLKRILLFFAVVMAFVAILAATQPADYRVERSLSMKATPAAIYAQVNDLHKWERWSPWARIDPNAKSSFNGPDSGKGASMSWDGNMDVGKGTMTISESMPNKSVQLKLVFDKPLPGEADSEILLTPEASGTKVTWSMSGKKDFMGKLMGLIMDCDKMIGDQYEKGLANLKAVVHG